MRTNIGSIFMARSKEAKRTLPSTQLICEDSKASSNVRTRCEKPRCWKGSYWTPNYNGTCAFATHSTRHKPACPPLRHLPDNPKPVDDTRIQRFTQQLVNHRILLIHISCKKMPVSWNFVPFVTYPNRHSLMLRTEKYAPSAPNPCRSSLP